MSDPSVSRRALLGYTGAGVVAASVPSTAGAAPAGSARSGLTALVAPLGPGSALGRWRIDALLEANGGAASVLALDATGVRFQLDVCARDPSPLAPRGPASTEHYEIFLANQGDGATGTQEDHGLCAMALAEVIRTNEAHVDRSGFRTLAERSEAKRHL